jgi:hypothetical protein
MYITDQDYINIGENALDIVQQSKPENREAAEKFAMDFAAGYLRARYDVNAAFAREGNEKHGARRMSDGYSALQDGAQSALPDELGEVREAIQPAGGMARGGTVLRSDA